MNFSIFNRASYLDRLCENELDVLVIGGGITGAGIALDTVTRGMKTGLVEMQDFAAGTSSRSTKLVHGGLRYLKQLEVKMVAEVGKERSIVYENGPHVTQPQWMLLPIHEGGTFGKISTSFGLFVYDFLAGVKKFERRRMLSASETLIKEPLIKREGLKGGGFYVEYRTDDARLTIEVLKAAVEHGAIACNYVKVTELLYDQDNKVIGVVAADQLTHKVVEIRAKKVINAAGPWVDHIRKLDNSLNRKTLKLSKGIHLVIDQSRFPLKQAIYFDTTDGRMIFAIPREKKVYVGTTDTFYDKDAANPRMTKHDCDYIIAAIKHMFPSVNISDNDIESSWAGVRPLIFEEGKDPSEISRKDEIWESESGLLTIAGGKLTGYRKMAETIADLLVKIFKIERGKDFSASQTKYLPISGGDVGGSIRFKDFVNQQISNGMAVGLSREEAKHLAEIYGSNVSTVYDLLKTNKDEAISYNIPLLLFAKLIYALEYEMIVTPIDFFYRRTGALLFNINEVKKTKDNVIAYMAYKMNWENQLKQKYHHDLEELLIQSVEPII